MAGFRPDHFHGVFQRHRTPVLPVGGERIQAIHRRQNTRPDGNLFASEAVRVSRAVPLLVMGPHDRGHRIGEAHALQNLGSHDRVNLHLVELFRRQLAGLRDDVLRHRQLSDVVQQGGRLQSLQFGFGEIQRGSQFPRVDLDSLQMVVRGVILGLDRQRQRLDGSEVQGRDFLGVFRFRLQPIQIQPVGTVDQIDHRAGEQHGLPAHVVRGAADRPGDPGSRHVMRQRPEGGAQPHRRERFMLGHRCPLGDRGGIDQEHRQRG